MRNLSIGKAANTVLLGMLLMASVAQKGKLFGKKNDEWFQAEQPEVKTVAPTNIQLVEGGFKGAFTRPIEPGRWEIINSGKHVGKVLATLEKNRKTFGFAGPIPMYVFLDPDERIQKVMVLPNSEDKEFLESALDKGVLTQWEGLDIEDALALRPDAVSGATMSSKAINTSILRSLSAFRGGDVQQGAFQLNYKDVLVVLALAFGVAVSVYSKKIPKLRSILLVVNMLVLGFWCGKFISFATLLGYVGNGVSLQTGMIGMVLVILAIGMPLALKKTAYYCTWVCPFGAAQELVGKLAKSKPVPRWLMAVLKHSRKCITVGLFAAMWMGASSSIVGYEPFSAFLFQHASTAVLVVAGLSLIISLFTPRPWCRFACPTGEMLKWMEKLD